MPNDNYKRDKFNSLGDCLPVEDFIKDLRNKEADAIKQGWIDLEVEIDQHEWSTSWNLFLAGKRPMRAEEIKEELKEQARRVAQEKQEYTRLKKKYGNTE